MARGAAPCSRGVRPRLRKGPWEPRPGRLASFVTGARPDTRPPRIRRGPAAPPPSRAGPASHLPLLAHWSRGVARGSPVRDGGQWEPGGGAEGRGGRRWPWARLHARGSQPLGGVGVPQAHKAAVATVVAPAFGGRPQRKPAGTSKLCIGPSSRFYSHNDGWPGGEEWRSPHPAPRETWGPAPRGVREGELSLVCCQVHRLCHTLAPLAARSAACGDGPPATIPPSVPPHTHTENPALIPRCPRPHE